jgi:DNA-binding NarL/FixJ family response regulator
MQAGGDAQAEATSSSLASCLGVLFQGSSWQTLYNARVVREMQGATQDAINPFTDLSDRELEVLKLIAIGASNTEIAAQLVIARRRSRAMSAIF